MPTLSAAASQQEMQQLAILVGINGLSNQPSSNLLDQLLNNDELSLSKIISDNPDSLPKKKRLADKMLDAFQVAAKLVIELRSKLEALRKKLDEERALLEQLTAEIQAQQEKVIRHNESVQEVQQQQQLELQQQLLELHKAKKDKEAAIQTIKNNLDALLRRNKELEGKIKHHHEVYKADINALTKKHLEDQKKLFEKIPDLNGFKPSQELFDKLKNITRDREETRETILSEIINNPDNIVHKAIEENLGSSATEKDKIREVVAEQYDLLSVIKSIQSINNDANYQASLTASKPVADPAQTTQAQANQTQADKAKSADRLANETNQFRSADKQPSQTIKDTLLDQDNVFDRMLRPSEVKMLENYFKLVLPFIKQSNIYDGLFKKSENEAFNRYRTGLTVLTTEYDQTKRQCDDIYIQLENLKSLPLSQPNFTHYEIKFSRGNR